VSVPDLSRLVTVNEAASALGVARQPVTSLPRAGKIPGAARIGRTWLMGGGEFEAHRRATHANLDLGLSPNPNHLGCWFYDCHV